jgi:hypothetical protein
MGKKIHCSSNFNLNNDMNIFMLKKLVFVNNYQF